MNLEEQIENSNDHYLLYSMARERTTITCLPTERTWKMLENMMENSRKIPGMVLERILLLTGPSMRETGEITFLVERGSSVGKINLFMMGIGKMVCSNFVDYVFFRAKGMCCFC